MIVLCFLICGRFSTSTFWQTWLSLVSPQYFEILIHVSNIDSCIEQQKIEKWCNINNGTIIPSIATSWSDPSVLQAEFLLFNCALSIKKNVSHFWLISEKTLPLIHPQLLIDHCNAQWKNKTLIEMYDYNRNTSPKEVLSYLYDYKMDTWWASQFLLLKRDHFLLIRHHWEHYFNEFKTLPWSYYSQQDVHLPMEEWIIPTLLVHFVGLKYIINTPVVIAKFTNDCVRADEYNMEETLKHLPMWLKRANTLTIPSGLGVRKCFDNEEVLSFLKTTNWGFQYRR
jgi:hypothetical protein